MNNEKNKELSLKDLWDIFRSNILLFVASVGVALLLAALYLLSTPPTYTRTASILIRDEQDGGKIRTAQMQSFEELGLFQSSSNINNELLVLRTPAYMQEVVKRLDLNYNYKVKSNPIRWSDLYNSTPFRVELDSLLLEEYVGFKISFNASGEFELTDVVVGRDDYDDISGAFGESVNAPWGSLTLVETPLFGVEAMDKEYSFSYSSVKRVADYYLSALSVGLQSEDASVVDISISDEVPQRASNIINTLISVYDENWLKDKNLVSINTNKFIEERLRVIEQELGIVDGDISNFKSENLIPDITIAANMQLTESKEQRSQQLVLDNQLLMARYIRDYISDDSKREQLIPASTGIENRALEVEIGNYNELLLQRDVLVANSGQRNPIVVDMNNRLVAIRGVIERSIEELINTLTLQVEKSKVVEQQTRNQLAKNPNQAKELINIERQQSVKEALYIFLLQRREENELSQAFIAYNTKIISMADGSIFPAAPRKSLILLFALLLGVALPVAYLFIKESLDTLVKSKSDLESLNIPLLGSLPTIDAAKKRLPFKKKGAHGAAQSNLVDTTDSRSIANEAFGVVRTNLDFILGRVDRCQVIQMISLYPSSGKTFVSANLSNSMSLKKGARVLVIDCDMRKSALSQYIGDPAKGVSNYLNGSIDNINDVIVKGKISATLDVIPVGTVPPNPSELLLSDRFVEMINKLKANYDYIFIDCPPAEVVPDAAIVGEICDVSIFVIRAGLFDKRYLPEVAAIYASGKFKNMSLLVNDVKMTQRYGYGYSYGGKA